MTGNDYLKDLVLLRNDSSRAAVIREAAAKYLRAGPGLQLDMGSVD